MNYLDFLSNNRRFLAFAVVMVGCSAFGQTYFISLFGGEIRETFDLTSGEFGSYYGISTLASGFSLIWLGGLVDRFDLRVVAPLVVLSLAGACLSMAFAPTGMLLIASFFLLRLTGQGFMTHTAMTTVGRYFDEDRGKAISIAATGFPVGQAILPIVAVTSMAAIGWRETWMVSALALVVALIPLILWLLRGHPERHARHLAERSRGDEAGDDGDQPRQWTRREVLGDPRFYILIPMLLSAPFILTGLFFHQVHLADEKGWSLEWMATGLICFSVVQLLGNLTAGSLIDRFSARVLYGWTSVPMILGLFVLASGNQEGIALLYLALGGLTAGIGGTVGGALWPELYGTKHLGSIRSMTSALMIAGTAASPAIYGWLIDAGISMDEIAIGSAIYTAVALVFIQIARRLDSF